MDKVDLVSLLDRLLRVAGEEGMDTVLLGTPTVKRIRDELTRAHETDNGETFWDCPNCGSRFHWWQGYGFCSECDPYCRSWPTTGRV